MIEADGTRTIITLTAPRADMILKKKSMNNRTKPASSVFRSSWRVRPRIVIRMKGIPKMKTREVQKTESKEENIKKTARYKTPEFR